MSADDQYIAWTAQPPLDTDITLFDTPPYEVMLNKNGEITQGQFENFTPDQKMDSIYLTMAANKARKTLGLPSLRELRFSKNQEAYDLAGSNSSGYTTDGGTTRKPNIELLQGKSYKFTFPQFHPIKFSETEDGTHQEGTEYTDFIVESTSTSVTINVKKKIPYTLYYYCGAHSGMGAKLRLMQPYRQEEVETFHASTKEKITEKILKFQTNLFQKLTVDEVAIDLGAIPGKDTEAVQNKINSLYYIPEKDEQTNRLTSDLTLFKEKARQGLVFIDEEDAIDAYGNILDEDESNDFPELWPSFYAHAFGANACPVNLDKELRPLVNQSRRWFWLKTTRKKIDSRILFQPPTVKDIALHLDGHEESIDVVSQKAIKTVQPMLAIADLTDLDDPKEETQNGIFFDDMYCLMNIKDPGMGINSNGGGGQDLSRLQRVRKAFIVDDDGLMSEINSAEFAATDQPRGGVYIGGCVIAPPNQYLLPIYDDIPRLDFFTFGAENQSLSTNKNLFWRIFNDFARPTYADDETFDLDSSVVTTPLTSVTPEDVLGLNLVWSEPQNFPPYISDDHFLLRGADGKTKGAAFQNVDIEVWTPSLISTELWLDSDDLSTITKDSSTNLVSTWSDKSGNENNATQSSNALQPSDVNLGDGIEFDGTNEGFILTNNISENDISVFVVMKGDGYIFANNHTDRLLFHKMPADEDYRMWWRLEDTHEFERVSVPNLNTSNVQIFEFSNHGTSLDARINGASGVNDSSDKKINIDRIGMKWDANTNVPSWGGNILEIIAVTSTTDREKIEGYLAHKWGLEGDLPLNHNFKSSAPYTSTSTPSPTPKPKFLETTVTSTDLGLEGDVITRKYRVLESNALLNINQFNLVRNRWFILDEYGYDLNFTAFTGPRAYSNVFLYNE